MNHKYYKKFLIIFSFLFFFQNIIALDIHPEKVIFCNIKDGEKVLKAARTDWLDFLKYQKSYIGGESLKDNIYNSILNVTGYDIGKNEETSNIELNPFDKFGLAGYIYSSYRGEFKYYDVNPCLVGERTFGNSSNYGQFYLTRKEPLSTIANTNTSLDIRSQVFSEGFANSYSKSFFDTFANMLLGIVKFLITILLSLLGLVFSDFSSLIGLGIENMKAILEKLYVNMYLPLISFPVLLTIVYMIYYGVYRRQYRQALNGLLKSFLAIFLGAVLLYYPEIVSLPNNLVLLGQNILVSSFTIDSSQNLCSTYKQLEKNDNIFDPKFIETSSNNLKSMIACNITNEFLFRPFIKAQFGSNFNDLNKLDNVNSDWVGKPVVKLGEKEIENWGLFYISVMSGTHSPLDKINSPRVGNVNKDYYRIVDALSNYEEDYYSVDENGNKTLEHFNEDEKIDYSKVYPEVRKTKPLKEWDYFIGNKNLNKITQTLFMLIYLLIAGVPLIILSVVNINLGVGITILMIFSPLFLLFGAWAGRGNEIMMKYFGTLLQLIIKRIFSILLLLIAISFVNMSMNLIHEVGFIYSTMFLCLALFYLIRKKDEILGQLSNFNFGNQLDLSGFKKGTDTIKLGGKLAASSAYGGCISKKNGGTILEGMSSGAGQFIKNKLYTSEFGRKAMTVYETNVKNETNSEKYCINCLVELKENSACYVDSNGSYWCEDCASAENFADMSEVVIDNKEDETTYNIRNENNNEYFNENGVLSTGTYMDYYENSTFNERYNKATTKEDKDNILNEVKSRVNINKQIFLNQLNYIRNHPNLKLGNVFIPDPIRHYIRPKDLKDIIKNNNIDLLEQKYNESWDKWLENFEKGN